MLMAVRMRLSHPSAISAARLAPSQNATLTRPCPSGQNVQRHLGADILERLRKERSDTIHDLMVPIGY
jgi:hypothetical protein